LTLKTIKKLKQITLITLILTSIWLAASFPHNASASIVIYQINPSKGNVGSIATISANVTTANDTYSLYFDNQFLQNGTATGMNVQTNITIPAATSGTHIVTIVDTQNSSALVNATNTFAVTTAYSIDIPTTKTIQEGDNVPVRVNVTGAAANLTQTTGTITVIPPTSTQYTQTVTIPVTNTGSGTQTLTYPTDFTAAANTSYVGDYNAFFNLTTANTTFHVQLTDANQYHRNQTVNIKAAYGPNDLTTITITGDNITPFEVNYSDPTGLINYNWTVPITANIATYNVSVLAVSTSARKTISDTQTISVPGFPINVTARNLANETVATITIQAYEDGNTAYTTQANTNATGVATIYLEIGNYTCKAIYQNVVLGRKDIQVNDTQALDIICNLTNIGIRTIANVGTNQIEIPEVGAFLTPLNNTYGTDLNGTIIIHSLLPNQTYTLNMTRFSNSFNITNIPNLLTTDNNTQAWYNITYIVPNENLQINVTKSDGQPFSDALIKAQDLEGAPIFQGTTDNNGQITFNAPFGRYTIKAQTTSGTTLNQTTTDLFGDNSTTLPCDLYGLDLTVQIVDYFGQGISGMNVQVQGSTQPQQTTTTTGNGNATFNNLIGGKLEVNVYSKDSTTPIVAQGINLQNSTSLRITISKYVLIAGTIIDASVFATIIIIIIALAILLIAEIYRRQRNKPEKTETPAKQPEKTKPKENAEKLTQNEKTDETSHTSNKE